MKDSEVLDLLINLGSIISEMFGENCEVAISQDRIVVAIFNGHVSNRTVGSPVGPEADERINNAADGSYVNYSKANVNNPKYHLKASTITLELDGKFTTFCINYDTTLASEVQQYLLDFLAISGVKANLASRTIDPIEEDFIEIVNELDKPVHLMNKQDRLKVVKSLYEKGGFNYQKSVPKIARLLGVTRYTIYNYLNELGI
ncbi:MAG: hypothetical protein GX995_03940 [Clostridiales bacterium]|nr:hypothetical protein [Clostridiales bacterium]